MRSSHERSFALVVFVILLASLGLGTALAQGEEGAGAGTSSAAVLLPPEANSLADLLASSSDGQQIEAEPAVDPVAAQNLPHSDLSRPEAEELLVEVFGGGLEGSAELLSELEVQAFRSDYVAVVPSPEPGADAGLLSSLLPLRAENEHGDKELIDLSLVAEGDHLEPSNPLVPIEIPSELSDGITFPDTGIVIDVASGETSRQASEVGDATAFFPNIRPDSDFVASAIPTGVETYTQLRSPEAPPTEIFDLTLPPGAELSEAAGGAQVVDSTGQVILSISAPSAIDAEERAIPVSIAVASGNRVVVSIDPPADTSYPVLVDPVFENYSWMNSNSNAGIGDWRSATQNQERLWPSWIGVWNQTMHAGLNLRSYAGSISPGSQANWNYYVPRYFSDFENPAVAERPTTFIRNMTLSQVYFLIEEGAPVHAHPYMLVGLWDGNKGQFASLGTRDGTQGQYNGVNIPLPNPGEYTNVKNGGIALATSESTTYPRQAFVGGAWVELSDNDSPASEEVGSVPEWLSTNAGAPIIYKFTDPGIGVHNVRLEYTRATGITATPITGLGCSGSVSNPCPRTVSKATKAIPYYPDLMAQGENWVKVIAQDAVSHFSNAGEVRIKVDRAKPELLTKGTLTEQAKVGTGLSEYGLSISATDGDEAEAAALTPHGAAGTGPGQLERPMGLAVDDTGNTWVTDRTNQRVIQYDAEGKLLREINAKGNADGQLNEPRGVAVAANGNIWVAEAGANKRVQQFSPTGTFVSKITNVNFVEPWGVALAPDGTVWITDLGAKKIFLYKSDGTFIRSFDSSQALSGGGLPVGLEVDEFGNAWIAFQGSDQVVAVSPNGEKVVSFGGTGTEPGKFKAPVDIAIAPSGNLLVSDDGNSRIQEFRPGGSFLRQFGAAGSASNQLKELRAIDLAPGNELRIADAGNKRVTRWSHADKHPESGVVKTEVKVDGVLKDLSNPGCTPKNCSISRSWTLDADDYPVGAHNVDVITTDGVGLQRKKSFAIETHGDLQAPAVTLSGTMTEQTTIGTTRPAYKLQVSATDPGSAAERKSGVISIVTMVDGALKDVGFQNCPSGGCSMTREWTLDSGKYSPGPHLVEVKATDGAGRSTAKLLNIQVDRDTTPPTLSLSGGLPTAPEGWVQQETKNATAIATDEKGYGVKQIRFSIDAVSVGQSAVQNCAAGACAASEIFAINMAAYNGGAHEAAMVAEDLAGNIRKKTWTINVDPEGHISATEAEDTLEAIESTTAANLVGPTGEEDLPGTVKDLIFQAGGTAFNVKGNEAPTSVFTAASSGVTVDIPPEEALFAICQDGIEVEEGAAENLTGAEEEALAGQIASCPSSSSGPTDLEPISIKPATTSSQVNLELADSDAAVVAANQMMNVDYVTRPLIDGAMIFTAIRDVNGPVEFEWRVNLQEDQDLELIDSQHAQVTYEGGHPAFSITVVKAHDAIGTTVPTSIRVDGNSIVLKVDHRQPSPAGGNFVYPVVAGAGWEGGFETYHIEMPPGEPVPEEEFEISEGGSISIFAVGPPVRPSLGSPGWSAQPLSQDPFERRYKFTYCWPKHIPGNPLPPGVFDPAFGGHGRQNITPMASECHREDFEGIHWGVTVHGHYEYKTHDWVRVNAVDCDHWGEEQPKTLDCKRVSTGAEPGTKNVAGEYRFHQGKGSWLWESKPTCLVWGGEIFPRKAPSKPKPYERPAVWLPKALTYHEEKCDWETYEEEAFGG